MRNCDDWLCNDIDDDDDYEDEFGEDDLDELDEDEEFDAIPNTLYNAVVLDRDPRDPKEVEELFQECISVVTYSPRKTTPARGYMIYPPSMMRYIHWRLPYIWVLLEIRGLWSLSLACSLPIFTGVLRPLPGPWVRSGMSGQLVL